MTMDKRTLKALHGSIRKWIKVATWTGKDMGTENCSLCAEFLYSDVVCCGKCPVFQRTGHQYCKLTPYDGFEKASKMENGDDDQGDCVVSGPKSQAAAERMALFLIDLLPEEEKARYYE